MLVIEHLQFDWCHWVTQGSPASPTVQVTCIAYCVPDLCFRMTLQQQSRTPRASKSMLSSRETIYQTQTGWKGTDCWEPQCYTYSCRILSKVSYRFDFLVLRSPLWGRSWYSWVLSNLTESRDPMERGSCHFNHFVNKHLQSEDCKTHAVICGSIAH